MAEESTKLYVEQYEAWADLTSEDRPNIERDRDYVDHKQWTSAEAGILLGRNQAPVVMNRIKPKVNFLKGLEAQSRTDPKAYPRTPKHESDSEAITDALRYVADNTDFDETASACFDELVVEGTEACITEVKKNPRGEIEIEIRQIPWDRFYYDGHSRKLNFSDATYMGITSWMYTQEAKSMFPGHDEEIDTLMGRVVVEAHEDRPRWRSKKADRIRVNEHYFKKDGIWYLVFFTEGLVLREEKKSPFKDEYGEPTCPIEAQSAYIGRDNDRYGEVRGLIHPQDEINHRRSKALHALSNVTLIRDKGTVKSGTRVLNQIASGKADIELLSEGRFEIDRNSELAQGQLLMLQEAKQEIDAQGANEALQGKGPGESGRALEARQAGGTVELSPILDLHRGWKRRVYRQMWFRIKQFWDSEKWVRITDDENNMKWAALNKPVTAREQLAEELDVDPSQVEAALEQQGLGVTGNLDQVMETRAQVSEIDADIILAESPDVVSIRQEQFAEISNLAQTYGPQNVPFEAILQLSSLRNKDEVIELLRGGTPESQQAIQAAQQAVEVEQENKQADTAAKLAKARKDNAQTDQTQVETQLALEGFESIG